MEHSKKIIQLEDYEQFVGTDTIERIREKARSLQDIHVANINSTYYGGGVAELLSSLTLLMNSVGIKTGWRIIQGSPDFFSITKKMHNALQGGQINLSERKIDIYRSAIHENSVRNHLDHDIVIIHDPQPLPMVEHYKKKGPWIWRCHVDLSNPHNELMQFFKPYIEKMNAMIVSIEEYKQAIDIPQLFFMPAIDPFKIKNKKLDDSEIMDRLNHYNIPTDYPLVVQISRFDKWKDPEGVIKAFKLAQKEIDATLVLLGEVALDDPEGENVYHSLLNYRDERIIILSKQDTALVNALQSFAAVVLQKSIREGFGLTVTEAMWKGTPVIGGNVGGIRYQIENGVNGFLVSSIEEAAERIVQVIKDEELRKEMGDNARNTVKEKFLLTRLLEQYINLFNSFHTEYTLEKTADIE